MNLIFIFFENNSLNIKKITISLSKDMNLLLKNIINFYNLLIYPK